MDGPPLTLTTNSERFPIARGLVPRCPLFRRLSTAEPGGVTVVQGPAGSGKTVLVRSWIELEELAHRVAWVSVERGERDAQRFWLLVVDQLASATDGAELVERVSPSPTFGGEAVVERLLSDLRSLERPVVLVIDDLHELRGADALRLLGRLVSAIPPELRVVLSTREDPQLGLHRLRVAGRLAEICGVDLRFSVEETRELMRTSDVLLSDSAVSLLHERTEGWAAGLRLAAISLAQHPEPERFVAEFSGSERTVAAYLLAEVLERQPAQVRDLLLRTSVLEWVTGPLADALTGAEGSEATLQNLEEANAFVTPLDVGRSRFRYHQLFADLLRLELRRSTPGLINSLHRAAAEWYDQNGYPVEAIRHAQSARDWPCAARLLADNYVQLVFDGRKATLRALLPAFPASELEANAELALAFATARLYDGALDESAHHIAAAGQLAATVPAERRPLFDLRLASATLWLACQRGDLAAANNAMRCFETLSVDGRADSSDHSASALMNLGIAKIWSLHLDDARRDLEAALALARRIRRPFLEVGCLGHLAFVALMTGSAIPTGLRLSEEAVRIAEEHGWETDRIVAPAVTAGAVALTWVGRFLEGELWLERLERAQQSADEFALEPMLHQGRGFVLVGLGRLKEALAEFRAAEASQPLLAQTHALRSDVRDWTMITQALVGETAAARAAIAALDAEERDRAGVRIAVASLHLAEGSPQDAVDAVAPLITHLFEPTIDGAARVLNASWAIVHALLLDAAARDRLGERRGAEASLERALSLAEPEGLVVPFVLAPVRKLLERHRRHCTGHVTLLLRILDVLGGSPPQSGEDKAPLREELSDAEMRVVGYLPSNLGAPEIASELFVSTNTIRTHLRHIYAKLDAHSRKEAVARARELRLLGPGSRFR